MLKRLRTSFVAACLAVIAFQPAIAEQEGKSGDQRHIDRGRYLVKIAGCNDCHTAGYAITGGNVAESQWLMGDKLGWHGAWGTTYAPNLRLFVNSLTEDQWLQFAKSGQARPPMPWWLLRDMNRQDLKAVYAYLKWLGPAGEPAPTYVPPGHEPVGPVVRFP